MSKIPELNAIQQISTILRRNLISGMLDVISEYKFCSSACYEAIEVLVILKNSYDDEDIETLKTFVRENLEGHDNTHLRYAGSRRMTTSPNLASFVKIALALKQLTTTSSASTASNSSWDGAGQDNDSDSEQNHQAN